jgi:cobaltochelatase CobN
MALPQIDGRIVSRPVSFKTLLDSDPETKADLVGYWPLTERIAFVAEVTRSRVGLRSQSRSAASH